MRNVLLDIISEGIVEQQTRNSEYLNKFPLLTPTKNYH